MTANQFEGSQWPAPQTRQEFETALDAGRLYVLANSGRYWVCRRNGRTQTWKTRPAEFRTPIKAGFRDTGAYTHRDLGANTFRIQPPISQNV